jgi:hypothetical protein
MKRYLIIVALLMVGCGVMKPGPTILETGTPYALSDAERQAVISNISPLLKNPSAKWGAMSASKAPYGEIYVCGWVANKGWKPFLGRILANQSFVLVEMAGMGPHDVGHIEYLCKQRSVPLPPLPD